MKPSKFDTYWHTTYFYPVEAVRLAADLSNVADIIALLELNEGVKAFEVERTSGEIVLRVKESDERGRALDWTVVLPAGCWVFSNYRAHEEACGHGQSWAKHMTAEHFDREFVPGATCVWQLKPPHTAIVTGCGVQLRASEAERSGVKFCGYCGQKIVWDKHE